MKADTIAAIATAISDSGIGIIRISGEHAIAVADKIYRTKNNNKSLSTVKSHTIHYGFIVDSLTGDVLDEVMIAIMKAPKSYTTEDTVEINCHGGVLIMKRILEEVLKQGARLAEPGEFTKRAFLNGRIDLTKAEAVIDIIHAENKYALEASVRQLKGSVSDCIQNLRQQILYEIAFIESALDDPEHISLEGYQDKLYQKTQLISAELKKLLDSSENGKMIKEGISTVIVGKPNAGKSSLLNILVGEEKAIVTDIAGTTRDILEENIRLSGIGLNIIDTAGIRETEDTIEKIGVERAKKYALDADLIVYVVDSSVPLDESDEEIIQLVKDKKCIVLLNKTDLQPIVSKDILSQRLYHDCMIIPSSTKENKGIDLFEAAVKDMFFDGDISFNNQIYITNTRHKEAIKDAYLSMQMVEKSIEDHMPEDFYSIDLMSAYAALGTIIGQEVGEDLVNEIFSKFCMGK